MMLVNWAQLCDLQAKLRAELELTVRAVKQVGRKGVDRAEEAEAGMHAHKPQPVQVGPQLFWYHLHDAWLFAHDCTLKTKQGHPAPGGLP
eukprot:3092083-Rhodomonas_salina.6